MLRRITPSKVQRKNLCKKVQSMRKLIIFVIKHKSLWIWKSLISSQRTLKNCLVKLSKSWRNKMSWVSLKVKVFLNKSNLRSPLNSSFGYFSKLTIISWRSQKLKVVALSTLAFLRAMSSNTKMRIKICPSKWERAFWAIKTLPNKWVLIRTISLTDSL